MQRLIFSVLIAAALAGPASAADSAALLAAAQQLQQGVTTSQPEEILKARAAFAALQQAEPGNARLACWIAVASWRAAPLLPAQEAEKAKRICKDGIAAADRAIALDPRLAEAVAIKAGLQGVSIGFHPALGMALGGEMDEAYGRAEGLDGDNPRVALLKAMNTMHKPEFVGGGAKRAMPQFDKAIALFEAEKPDDAAAMQWGRADARIWAGRCQMKLGDAASAKAHYQKALELDAGNVWVGKVLMPAADKALAGKVGK